jgi:hypothetical protein
MRYIILILIFLLIILILYQPYKCNKNLENFDEIMPINTVVTKFSSKLPEKKQDQLTPQYDTILLEPPPSLIIPPTRKQQEQAQKQVQKQAQEKAQESQVYEPIIEVQPIIEDKKDQIVLPLDPCACDCNALQTKIDAGCSDLELELQQCKYNLAEQDTKCIAEKGQLEIAAANGQLNQSSETTQLRLDIGDSKMRLETCNKMYDEMMTQNKILFNENDILRKQIVELQNSIILVNKDTQACQTNYNNLGLQLKDMTGNFTTATQRYQGVTNDFYNVANDYMGFIDNIDKCASFSYKYNTNVQQRADDRKKNLNIEQQSNYQFGK